MTNYLHDVIMEAVKEGIAESKIRFIMPDVLSPYTEVNTKTINLVEFDKGLEIAINPYRRFGDMFCWLNREYGDENHVKTVIFDIGMHFLARIDAMEGVSAVEIGMKYILKLLEEGVYGDRGKEINGCFDIYERRQIAKRLLATERAGESFREFREIIISFYKNAIIYSFENGNREVLLYLPKEKNFHDEKRIEILKELFMPIVYELRIFWKRHFGVIGVGETMRIGEIEIY